MTLQYMAAGRRNGSVIQLGTTLLAIPVIFLGVLIGR